MSDLTKLRLIYKGGGTEVHEGQYSGNYVVIKTLDLTVVNQASVENEVSLQHRLSTHRNVCKVLTWWLEPAAAVLVLERMQQDLNSEIASRSKNSYLWTEAELAVLFRQLIDVFAFAQVQKVAHRDIKPQNIFVSETKELKVGDFGTAKSVDWDSTSTTVGTPYFLSPELKARLTMPTAAKYNPYVSDVYSLGMTFLNMINLKTSPELLIQSNLVEKTQAVLRLVPECFRELLTLMLQPDPSQRCDFLYLWACFVQGRDCDLEAWNGCGGLPGGALPQAPEVPLNPAGYLQEGSSIPPPQEWSAGGQQLPSEAAFSAMSAVPSAEAHVHWNQQPSSAFSQESCAAREMNSGNGWDERQPPQFAGQCRRCKGPAALQFHFIRGEFQYYYCSDKCLTEWKQIYQPLADSNPSRVLKLREMEQIA